ncbi:MAG: DUF1302 family protein [Acidobacteriota bacterium]
MRRAALLGCIMLAGESSLIASLQWHGFVLGNYAARLDAPNGHKPASGDFLLAEERFQLKMAASASEGQMHCFVKTDLVRDEVDSDVSVDVREVYVSFAEGPLDLSIGRQIHTWGVGDLLFINDLFPKDYAALFSGRPMEYLKVGSSGVKASLYGTSLSLDVVVTPFFEADVLPSADRFFLFDPFSGLVPRVEAKPRRDLQNTEIAARLRRSVAGFDVAAYAYRGFYRIPSTQPDSPTTPTMVSLVYPKLSSYGASAQGNALGGVLSIEAGYHDSREDRDGSNPVIPNSQTRFLIGYQRSPWSDTIIGFQYYGEYMQRYRRYEASLPAGFPKQDRLRQVLTLRLMQSLKYQTWRISLFTFWSPTDHDFYAIPELAHRLSDELSLTLGANIFGGSSAATFFGQLSHNDNLYFAARYDF